jgi:hypothetical protein
MHYINDWNTCDQTRELSSGGFYAPGLEGLASRELVDAIIADLAVQNSQAAANFLPYDILPPGIAFQVPAGTVHTAEALDPEIWVRPVQPVE